MTRSEIQTAIRHLKAYERTLRNEPNTFKRDVAIATTVPSVRASIAALEAQLLAEVGA